MSVLLTQGSSPLARGLRSRSRWGIIPARAGFTSGALWGLPSCGDHPRSRGVYQAVAVRSASPTGSSPLARGLLQKMTMRYLTGGDHPRSRGVYEAFGALR